MNKEKDNLEQAIKYILDNVSDKLKSKILELLPELEEEYKRKYINNKYLN